MGHFVRAYHMVGWYPWVNFIFAILIWSAIIGLMFWAVSSFSRRPHMTYAPPVATPPVPPQPSAVEILRQRFACGEIDAATFDEMRKKLGDNDQAVTL
jgi:putative membrane protein